MTFKYMKISYHKNLMLV